MAGPDRAAPREARLGYLSPVQRMLVMLGAVGRCW